MRYFLTVRRKVVVGHPAPHVCCELQRWSASYATALVSNTRIGQKNDCTLSRQQNQESMKTFIASRLIKPSFKNELAGLTYERSIKFGNSQVSANE